MKTYAYYSLCALLLFIVVFVQSCMNYGPSDEEDLSGLSGKRGVFITNEGNFMYGNASLSYYGIEEKLTENDVFARANGRKLGDVAQSMAIYNGIGYVVVNNSGVIYIIDIDNFKVIDEITGFISPRYIHFINENKAYVSDLYAGRISIVDPKSAKVTGYIDTPGHKSTEKMVQYGRYVFVNCWAYDDKILVIDSQNDAVVDSIEVGIQPSSIVIDKNKKIWVTTDGGYEDSPMGWEAPTLYRIDAERRQIEKYFEFEKGDLLSGLNINGTGDTIYYINDDIWQMGIADSRLPLRSLIAGKGTIFYGLGIDPHSSDIYVADAIDYVQSGIVYRYSPQAVPLDTLRVGITPGSFCFK